MVLDTSALLAILLDEPDARAMSEAMEDAEQRYLSTASFLETSMVVQTRFGPEGIAQLDLLLGKAAVKLVPVDESQAHIARQAFAQYGKGRHPAALNFGDCFAYALARALEMPLLCKGSDFRQTDIVVVLQE